VTSVASMQTPPLATCPEAQEMLSPPTAHPAAAAPQSNNTAAKQFEIDLTERLESPGDMFVPPLFSFRS
jgi:hypothetical protein